MSETFGWNDILDVIEEDCIVNHRYRNAKGEFCFIAGLAHKAGLDDALPEFGTRENGARIGHFDHLSAALLQAFPVLKYDDLLAMQRLNDRSKKRENRQRSLRNYVEVRQG